MLSFETILLFVSASTLLALAPGPDNLFVLAESMRRGARAGIMVTLGLMTGLIVHTTAVALGVAVIFQTSQLAFDLLKYIGAGYLLYLALLSFRATGRSRLSDTREALTVGQLYRRGIIMNVTNPKVSIFFLAFLPQFTDPTRGSVTLQIFLLGFLFFLSALTVFGLISLLAGRIGAWFMQTEHGEKFLNWAAGTVFGLLALKLLFTER